MEKNDISLIRMVNGELRRSMTTYVPEHERKHVNAMCLALELVIGRNTDEGGDTGE